MATWRWSLALAPWLLISTAAAAAVDAPKPSWTVLHCGLAKGVLYLTYAEDGQAAITPAVDNRAVRAACATAGYPVGGRPRGRLPLPSASGSGAAVVKAPAPVRMRADPEFSAQAVGNSLSIDARNGGDATQSCLISYAWTWDGNDSAPRSGQTQASLPGHQRSRVVTLTTPGYGARFIASPQSNCRAMD